MGGLDTHPAGCPGAAELAAFVERRLPAGPSDAMRDHLDGCDACRAAVLAWVDRARSRVAVGTPSDGRTEPGDDGRRPSFSELAAGTRLQHFVLGRRLGEGGMGVVYQATDTRLDRQVAIKLVRGDGASGGLLDEARAMARVRHPAVLTVYEVGEHDGLLYIAMELVQGGTLRGHLASARRTQGEILELYARAGEGLAAAHAAGVVHRDFKPDNVLVDAGGQRVLVADFGLARGAPPALPVGGEGRRPQPGEGGLAPLAEGSPRGGTPGYMAPEQLDGAPVDARADIFALAASLWEALYGSSPFPGRTPAEQRAAMQAPPVLPAQPALPPRVGQALLAALAIDPARRTASVSELVSALRGPPARRRWRLVVPAAVVLVAASGLALWAARRPAPHAGSAVPLGAGCEQAAGLSFSETAWRERARQGGVPPEVQDQVVRSFRARQDVVAAQARLVCVRPEAAARRAFLGCRAGQQIAERAALAALAERWPSYDRLPSAFDLPWVSTCSSRAAELDLVLEPSQPAEQALVAGARHDLAMARFAALAGRPEAEWRPLFASVGGEGAPAAVRDRLGADAAIELLRVAPPADRVTPARAAVELAERRGAVVSAARAWLALSAARLGALGDAADDAPLDDALERASWAIERVGNPPELLAGWHMLMALRARQKTDVTAARAHASQALELAKESPPSRGYALIAMASSLAAAADYAGECELLEPMAEDPDMTSGANARWLWENLAECRYHLEQHARAHEALAHSLALPASPGDLDERVSDYNLEGAIFLEENRLDEALAASDRALAICRDQLGNQHMDTISALNLRVTILGAMNRPREALAASQEAERLAIERLGPLSEEAIFARSQTLGLLGALPGQRRAEVVEAMRQLVDDARKAYGADDPRVADLERSLAGLVSPSEARTLLEHALTLAAAEGPAYGAQTRALLAKLLIRSDRPRALALAREALAVWEGQAYWKSEHDDLAAWLQRVAR